MCNRANLVAGTPITEASSLIILRVLSPDDDEDEVDLPNVFQKLSLLRSVAQKILQSIGSDRPFIAKPAREARDILKNMGESSLQGLF